MTSATVKRQIIAEMMDEQGAAMDRERIAKLIAIDLLNAVQAIFGDEGLDKVVRHMKAANRAREDNNEIDALEKTFASLKD